jgi:hypothetical protein
VTIQERIARIDDYRRVHDNVIRLDEQRERRAPQKWWEKAEANQLVNKDFTSGDAA